jgi:hypothetical protein
MKLTHGGTMKYKTSGNLIVYTEMRFSIIESNLNMTLHSKPRKWNRSKCFNLDTASQSQMMNDACKIL